MATQLFSLDGAGNESDIIRSQRDRKNRRKNKSRCTTREAIMADRQRLLELAMKGLQADRARIDDEIAEIKSQLNSGVSNNGAQVSTATSTAPKKKRTMSAAARKKISDAMKRRYAGIKKADAKPNLGRQSRSGGLTAEGRTKLSEMMKARWAAKRKSTKRAA
jgi:hypothetical protein